MNRIPVWLLVTAALTGCSSPKPILYPNAHFQQVGSDAAEEDIRACRQLAEDSGATARQGKSAQVGTSTVAGGAIGAAAGAVGGAVIGNPGRGAKGGGCKRRHRRTVAGIIQEICTQRGA